MEPFKENVLIILNPYDPKTMHLGPLMLFTLYFQNH